MSTLIASRIGTTAELVLYASLIIVVSASAWASSGGLRPGCVDTSVLVVDHGLGGDAGVRGRDRAALVFAVKLGWFPALGQRHGLRSARSSTSRCRRSRWRSSSLALVARVTRAAVREELGREHVQTAVSRGIPCRQVIRRHVLRNAAIPITTVVGITIASLIAVARWSSGRSA